jgi:hypothetical protein
VRYKGDAKRASPKSLEGFMSIKSEEEDELKAWALANGSGTLRQAIQFEMSWRDQARHERLAMEVASAAMFVQTSRLTTGKYKAEPDCRVTTELGWYARVLQHRFKQHKVFCRQGVRLEVVYFCVSCPDELDREGAGFMVEGLPLSWAPKGSVVLIPLAYWDKAKRCWVDQENPL